MNKIETPSGKDQDYENFPVGSWLLPARLRPHIALFYDFARAADDIADNPNLASAEKIARLDDFEAAVTGAAEPPSGCEKAARLYHSLQQTGVPTAHCVDLLAAFKQDAVKDRYADWGELIAYCRLSAAPVGRYLLDLHGGSQNGYGPSDALCIALQIINHLQDCREDYQEMNRVYLPADWLAAHNTNVEELALDHCTGGIRGVLDQTLDGVYALLATANALPSGLHSRRLALESAAILAIARRLATKLRRSDPLAGRVALGKFGYFSACGRGVLQVVPRLISGTSS